jgi:hypothetical protein
MQLRQRLSLAFMRAVEARGLSFVFPTQTVQVTSLPELKGRRSSPGHRLSTGDSPTIRIRSPSIQRLPIAFHAEGHDHGEEQ